VFLVERHRFTIGQEHARHPKAQARACHPDDLAGDGPRAVDRLGDRTGGAAGASGRNPAATAAAGAGSLRVRVEGRAFYRIPEPR
jgi:hypothetical protein